jgi:hypothetical protein
MTTRNGNRNVTNRFEVVSCQACGRRAARKSRQQKFCSDRYATMPGAVHRLREIERIGGPLATIDAQIRLISLMTRRQMWSCRPGGAA